MSKSLSVLVLLPMDEDNSFDTYREDKTFDIDPDDRKWIYMKLNDYKVLDITAVGGDYVKTQTV